MHPAGWGEGWGTGGCRQEYRLPGIPIKELALLSHVLVWNYLENVYCFTNSEGLSANHLCGVLTS